MSECGVQKKDKNEEKFNKQNVGLCLCVSVSVCQCVWHLKNRVKIGERKENKITKFGHKNLRNNTHRTLKLRG